MESERPLGHASTQGTPHAPLRLEKFLPYRLNLLASLVSEALSRIYAERYRIAVPEWRVLVTLGQYEVMTGKAIGAHSHMHKTRFRARLPCWKNASFCCGGRTRQTCGRAFCRSRPPAGRCMRISLRWRSVLRKCWWKGSTQPTVKHSTGR